MIPYYTKRTLKALFLFLLSIAPFVCTYAQKTIVLDSSKPGERTVLAGAEYKRGGLHQSLWGKDYRKEWTTPVTVPVLNLDSAFGGLTPIKEGGGRQTKSLRLKDSSGRVFVLRTVNKTYLGALPEIVSGTFVETLANDQIATNHPYAALTVPKMAEAAGVPHTNPRYFIVPPSPRLGEYNATFANTLCLLEERPDDTQADQASFGEADDIVNTEKMLDKIEEENDHLMDQHAYVKARLFDMLIGDWGRHKDNWRWSKTKEGSKVIYRPVPKDRDQTFAKFEGTLLGLILRVGSFKELQTFDEDVRNIKWYNYPAFPLDKRFTNELTIEVWEDTARALQRYLTDEVIEAAVQNMPPEIVKASGNEIIRKLKGRRKNLLEWARKYYFFLSGDVDIPGTQQAERFEVTRLNKDETAVQVYRMNKEGNWAEKPIFNRTFNNNDTKEIRLYGIGGNDVFYISGEAEEGMKIRAYGGRGKDSLIDVSSVGGWGHQTKFYDSPGDAYATSKETKVHTSRDSAALKYQYDVFHYDTRGVRPVFLYNGYYRFYVGIGYTITLDKTRGRDFRQKHNFGINYSIIEKSFSPYYRGAFRRLIGSLNLNVALGYDQVRRFNYFGTGNETVAAKSDISYYYLRTKNLYGSIGIEKELGPYHSIALDVVYNGVKVYENAEGFINKKTVNTSPDDFSWKHFAGPQLSYSYTRTNDKVLPTKGIIFRLAGAYSNNLQSTSRYVTTASSSLNWYLPVVKPVSIAIKTGGATLWGDPEFYQRNNLGGYYTLRGYWRYRWWGTSVFYNQNEIRWLPYVKGRAFKGRLGLLAFYDQGRIWQAGETSSKWHTGYGGGVILVPFNMLAITITESWSVEGRRLNIRLGKLF